MTKAKTEDALQRLRASIPAIATGTAYFDGPGGTQVPAPVADAVRAAMTTSCSNRGLGTSPARASETVVRSARVAGADLLGTDADRIVFGRSATQLTFDVARALQRSWTAEDEVVVTRLDHDANVAPWVRAAEVSGARIRWVDVDPVTRSVELDAIRSALSTRTRLVAVTGASNLLGARPPIDDIAFETHQVGALLYVDGVHLTPHAFIDVDSMDADFFVCSSYKMLGPHCGVLTARGGLLDVLEPAKLTESTDRLPERFELGTLPYELLAGFTASVDLVASLAGDQTRSRRERLREAMSVIECHENGLLERFLDAARTLRGLSILNPLGPRTPTALLSFEEIAPEEATRCLDDSHHVVAPSGTFYAGRAARAVGAPGGGLRVGLAPYTNDEDVDRLVDGLRDVLGRTRA